MASHISELRTIRIRKETAEYFKGKPLNKVVDNVYREIQRGNLEVNGEEIWIRGCLVGVPKGTVKDLEMICDIDGMTFTELFNELYRALDEGEIELEDGHFRYMK